MRDIPLTVIERFPDYLNYLRGLDAPESGRISSGTIAKVLGLGEVLVRKDLAYTSCAGKPRIGYSVSELIAALESALGCDSVKNAVIVGVGALGGALLSYGGFGKYGIELVAGFDSDPAKTDAGADKPVLPMEDLPVGVEKYGAYLGLICVPAAEAQGVCDALVAAGVKRILNFAPTNLTVSDGVKVRTVDLAANLVILASI